ncbi:MAG: hypothetical protein QIT40_gp17 [Lokiarchaeia virus VerdaV4]|uniref:Uncharacterized protein n=1 Tax=Lokiarchaeia virus VerdaV4 TaxID=3070172 RepID=A0AA35CNI7_9CAUD|nr:MAG: hypothetical protein QIT40_gp17 [Lokiarchaeia virus VerdaV4]BDI54975.1 MAG: hypothetical protein [Lokiarchaeia virus VerdaV4]
MSKHSLRYTFNEDKFNLKTIIYLFILIDFFLAFVVPFIIVISLIGYEASMIIGLMIGLKGQNKFKVFMFELRGLVDDPKYNKDEDLRGHLLKQKVYHACLEWGIWFEKRLEEYGLDFKKKLKNLMEVIRRMDDFMLKEIMRIVAVLWLTLGLGLLDVLILLNLRPLWLLAFMLAFYAGDFFFWLIMEHYYGIFKENIEPIAIGKVAVIKGEIAEIETKLQ